MRYPHLVYIYEQRLLNSTPYRWSSHSSCFRYLILQHLPRIQIPNTRTNRPPIKHKLTDQLARPRPVLNPPTRMPRRQQQPPHTRLPDQRPSTRRIHIRQITRLPHRDLTISQLIRDRRHIIDNILTPRVIRLHLCRSRRQSDKRIAFAAGIDFVVGPGVDFRRDGFGMLALGACDFVAAAGEGGGKADFREEGVGGNGTGGPDCDAVGAEGGDRGWWVDGLSPGAGGYDDVCCGDGVWFRGGFVRVCDGCDGVRGLIDTCDGAEDDVDSLFGREVGHGGGKLVGVHLGCGVWASHFVVVFCAFCGHPIQILGDPGRS